MNTELLKNIFKSEVDYLEISKRLEDETDPQVAADYFDKLQHDEETIAIWKKQFDIDWNSAKTALLREEALFEFQQEAEEMVATEQANLGSKKALLTSKDVFDATPLAQDVYNSKSLEISQEKLDIKEALTAELIVEGEIWQKDESMRGGVPSQ